MLHGKDLKSLQLDFSYNCIRPDELRAPDLLSVTLLVYYKNGQQTNYVS